MRKQPQPRPEGTRKPTPPPPTPLSKSDGRMNDRDKAIEIISKLDEIARDYEPYEYGLPMFSDASRENMINAVLDVTSPRCSK